MILEKIGLIFSAVHTILEFISHKYIHRNSLFLMNFNFGFWESLHEIINHIFYETTLKSTQKTNKNPFLGRCKQRLEA